MTGNELIRKPNSKIRKKYRLGGAAIISPPKLLRATRCTASQTIITRVLYQKVGQVAYEFCEETDSSLRKIGFNGLSMRSSCDYGFLPTAR